MARTQKRTRLARAGSSRSARLAGPPRPLPPPGRLPLPVPPRPPGDARAVAELLLRQIADRKARIANEFYEIGIALRTLAQPQMHGVLGFKTFDELIAARKPVGRVTALKLMSIVDAFDRKQAITLGVEKAYAIVRYTVATPAADVARTLVANDARIDGRPISALSAAEIAGFTRRLRGSPNGPPPDQAAARGRARAVQQGLRKRGLKKATVRAVYERGAWWLTVHLPISDGERFLPLANRVRA